MLVLVYITTMADIPEPIPIHPVAPRLKEGHKKPHVGPHIGAYKATHAETIGHESDKWWAKVCLYWLEYVRMNLILCRWPAICFTGIVHSRLFVPVDCKRAI